MTSIANTIDVRTARERSASGRVPTSGNEQRQDVHFSYSENVPALLAKLKSSLLVSTYRTGNLVTVSQRSGRLTPSFHLFDRPMGIAIRDNGIAVGARSQVWFLRSAPDVAAKLEPRGQHDGAFLTRHSHFTGDVHCHELAWVGNELWFVNTLFSCLCTLHPAYNFAPRWRPPFVSALVPEDRCHLNGFATSEGKIRYVSAMAETDVSQGWRAVKATSGCLIDFASGTTIARGLTMPHSPRVAEGKLFVLNSGLGGLEMVDPTNGHREVVCHLPGYVRGLAIVGSLAFVGLSKIRQGSAWTGVPIADHPERLKCGVWVVDLGSGKVVGHVEFSSGVDELFDVQLFSGVTSPYLSGPMPERDIGQPLWTLAPTLSLESRRNGVVS